MEKKIQKLVDKASENFGNDTILSFITDELLELVEECCRAREEQVRREFDDK